MFKFSRRSLCPLWFNLPLFPADISAAYPKRTSRRGCERFSRSPVKRRASLRVLAFAFSSAIASAQKTVPTGACVEVVGPASPVAESAKSAWKRFSAPVAISVATASLTALFSARVEAVSASTRSFRAVGIGDRAAVENFAGAGNFGDHLRQKSAGQRFGDREFLSAPRQFAHHDESQSFVIDAENVLAGARADAIFHFVQKRDGAFFIGRFGSEAQMNFGGFAVNQRRDRRVCCGRQNVFERFGDHAFADAEGSQNARYDDLPFAFHPFQQRRE